MVRRNYLGKFFSNHPLAFDSRRPKSLMARKFYRRVLIAVTILFGSCYFLGPILLPNELVGQRIKSRSSFQLPNHTDSCPIPKIDFQKAAIEIERLISKTAMQILKCSEHYEQFSEFTKDQKGLKLLSSAADWDCCVYEVSRPKVLKNDSYVISNCEPFTSFKTYTISSPTTEYFIVKCNRIQSNRSKFNYHTRILTKVGSIGAKVEYWKENSPSLPLNVVVLVFDSTSAQDAHRQLPQTMKFLLESMDFIQFQKYIVLGEPTKKNAIPLLLGQKAEEFMARRKRNDYWDSEDFIWKAFNSSGFVTGFAEDIPDLATFNYGGQAGFRKQPTDSYMRPLFKAREAFKGGYNSRNYMGKLVDVCFGPKHYWNIIYDHQIELLKKLQEKAPVYLIPWLCWPFHDSFGTLKYLDQDTLRFFQQIQAEPQILDNTLIMVLGDHGFRFRSAGKYPNSAVGLIERRLPLFMIRLPKNLLLRNPKLLSIVKSNSQTVTTHYDTYQTLLELSNFKNPNQRRTTPIHGQSLLKLLPANRTCQDAHIPQNYCPCGLPQIQTRPWNWDQVPKEYLIS